MNVERRRSDEAIVVVGGVVVGRKVQHKPATSPVISEPVNCKFSWGPMRY